MLNILLRVVFVPLHAKMEYGTRPILELEPDMAWSAYDQWCQKFLALYGFSDWGASDTKQ